MSVRVNVCMSKIMRMLINVAYERTRVYQLPNPDNVTNNITWDCLTV